MRITELFKSVLLNIKANKSRVFLTSLGIIIGTFTIIMVVGIGKASEKAVQDQYKKLSVETITVTPSRGKAMGPSQQVKPLKKEDMLKAPDLLQHVKTIAASINMNSDIVCGNNLAEGATIAGVTEDFASITNMELEYGEFISNNDSEARNKVAVLGYNLATTLFEDSVESCIGKNITIKGSTFQVIGVLKEIGGETGAKGKGGSNDDMAYIPIDVAIKYSSNKKATVTPNYIVLANDIDSVENAIEEINQYIGELIGNSDNYSVSDAGSKLKSAQDTAKTMESLLISIAVIVLIVSGIGIMNVLMVAVKERTREIGILKSIGFSRKDILLEFLLEAIFISIIGSFIGVILSIFAPYVLKLLNLSFIGSTYGILLGVLFSVGTGIFFGYYPAVKASKLKPIEALNYD